MKVEYPIVNPERTGQFIRFMMDKNGLKVKDIQKYLELNDPQCVYNWFHGRNMPSLENLCLLSELFCVSVDSLIKDDFDVSKKCIEKKKTLIEVLNHKKTEINLCTIQKTGEINKSNEYHLGYRDGYLAMVKEIMEYVESNELTLH